MMKTAKGNIVKRRRRPAAAHAVGRRTSDLIAVGVDADATADRLNILTPGLLRTVPGRADRTADDPGENLVVMSKRTFRALFEQSEDAAARRAFERTRAEESVPSIVIDRLSTGEHPIHVWREHRGLTLGELGAAAGLSTGYLSEIEGRKKPGSLKALRAIARALRLELDDLTAWL